MRQENQNNKQNQSELPQVDKETLSIFDLPANYFENFVSEIVTIVQYEEDKVLDIPKYNEVMQVPEHYFTEFPAKILSQVQTLEELEIKNNLPPEFKLLEETTYQVPHNYFEQLHNNVMIKLNSEEEVETLPELLSELKGTNPYLIPADYLNTFEVNNTHQQHDNVVTFKKKRSTFSLARVAAAAVIVISFSIGLWTFSNVWNSNGADTVALKNTNENAYKLLASVDKASVEHYINNNIEEFDENRLLEYYALESHAENNIKEVLNDISKEDILRYLEEAY